MATATATAFPVAIDIDSEDLIPIREAPQHFPTPRKPCHQSVHRWYTRGTRGAVLATVMIAGLRYTSVEAISRFIAACNRDNPSQQPTADPVRARRERQSRAAMAALAGR